MGVGAAHAGSGRRRGADRSRRHGRRPMRSSLPDSYLLYQAAARDGSDDKSRHLALQLQMPQVIR